jgi:hypothetical protein
MMRRGFRNRNHTRAEATVGVRFLRVADDPIGEHIVQNNLATQPILCDGS